MGVQGIMTNIIIILFGSFNSYGMNLGHAGYVRTKAMGWNTVQLARDLDYSGNDMKYCEWPFYDYEIIHVATDPPAWFSQTGDPQSSYGFDLSVGGVWAAPSAPNDYIFCRGFFTLDITKYMAFYISHGYIPSSGNWNNDVTLINPQPINRNIFRQGQLIKDQWALDIRSYFTPTTWNAPYPIVYDQTCPYPEWKGNKCYGAKNCVTTPEGQGIYYQAMNASSPVGAWPLGTQSPNN